MTKKGPVCRRIEGLRVWGVEMWEIMGVQNLVVSRCEGKRVYGV